MKTAILLGTSREGGNTSNLVQAATKELNASVFDLANYDIAPYDYDFNNQEDDFVGLINTLWAYDHIILATPMYWYAPSAQMKIFIDRLSDLMTINKSLGRALRGKKTAVLATGYDSNPPSCFEQMLSLTLIYLGTHYSGMLYCACENNFEIEKHHSELAAFSSKLRKVA
jgi:multimeric flavodoxin WrbA